MYAVRPPKRRLLALDLDLGLFGPGHSASHRVTALEALELYSPNDAQRRWSCRAGDSGLPSLQFPTYQTCTFPEWTNFVRLILPLINQDILYERSRGHLAWAKSPV